MVRGHKKLRREHGAVKALFDDGNEYKAAFDKGYRAYYANSPETYLSKVPLFDDDEMLFPLQAADLLAWEIGRRYERPDEPVRPTYQMLEFNPPH